MLDFRSWILDPLSSIFHLVLNSDDFGFSPLSSGSFKFALIWIFSSAALYFDTCKLEKFKADKFWWAQVDSNHRPHAYQACALTC